MCKLAQRKKKFKILLLDWHEENNRQFPWREENRSAYDILIAEIMLRRTTADQVNKLYEKFLEQYPNPKSLAEGKREKIAKFFKPLGLRHQRAKQLIKLGNTIIKNYNFKIPKEKKELLKLPGVGEYTADAVRSFTWGYKVPIIDGNVRRVMSSYFKIETDSYIKNVIMDMMEGENPRKFNFAMLDFGALICGPRKHRCKETKLKELCYICKD